MGKELMWACALLPEEVNQEIVSICKRANRRIGLPETVFKFPLHISLKKSWECDRFLDARQDVAEYLKQSDRFSITTGSPSLHKGMIWLSVNVDEKLKQLHEGLDALLETKYGVPRSTEDLRFHPHISLFTRGDGNRLSAIQQILAKELLPVRAEIRRVVVGGAIHRDTYYEL